jgi:hypothetical protein
LSIPFFIIFKIFPENIKNFNISHKLTFFSIFLYRPAGYD